MGRPGDKLVNVIVYVIGVNSPSLTSLTFFSLFLDVNTTNNAACHIPEKQTEHKVLCPKDVHKAERLIDVYKVLTLETPSMHAN